MSWVGGNQTHDVTTPLRHRLPTDRANKVTLATLGLRQTKSKSRLMLPSKGQVELASSSTRTLSKSSARQSSRPYKNESKEGPGCRIRLFPSQRYRA